MGIDKGNPRQKFLDSRLSYYADLSSHVDNAIKQDIDHDVRTNTVNARQEVVSGLGNTRWDLCIVTATRNRLDFLKQAHHQLDKQKGDFNWRWLLVDNSSDTSTKDYFDQLEDERVFHVPYLSQAGCAFPVRNYGFNVIAEACKLKAKGNGWVMVIDSDDELFDEYSLQELKKTKELQRVRETALVHGFSVCEYDDNEGNITYGTHPHNLDSGFPEITKLSQVFDKGLNILSGMFPIDTLQYINYPPERSFEDNGFNHKLMLYAKKHFDTIAITPNPITKKRFHNETMAKTNDSLGDQDNTAVIGEHTVAGIRADIVTNLAYLTDYFVREDL